MRRIFALLPLLALASGCIDIPDAPKRQTVRQSAAPISRSPDARQCLSELGATHANFTVLPDRYFGNGCSNLNTVSLSSLQADSSSLGLSNLGPVSCSMANDFAGWARYGVDRAARVILGSPISRIETMGSYACRNVAGTSRLSAHATANAVDVSAFILTDGRRISVADDWSGGTGAEREFLRRVQQSACKRFSTVLGPEYNAAHRDHLHVEVGGRAGNFCR